MQKTPLTKFSTHLWFSSVQFRCSVVSNSLWSHESQHARHPCPSPTPRVYPNSCPESVMPSNHLILCCPLFLLPSIFPSIRVQGTLKSLLTTQPSANHFIIRSGSLVFLSAKWVNSSLPCLPEGWLGLHRGIPTKSALKGTTLHKGAQREPAS